MLHSLWAAIAAKTIFISNYIVQGLFYLIAVCFTDTIVHQAGIPRGTLLNRAQQPVHYITLYRPYTPSGAGWCPFEDDKCVFWPCHFKV